MKEKSKSMIKIYWLAYTLHKLELVPTRVCHNLYRWANGA